MKIATLNLRHNQDRWEDRFPLVVDTLSREQADVVGLQEVYLPIQQAQRIAEAVNAREPARQYTVYVEPKWGPQPVEGVALLSRLPILDQERLELPEGERVAQRITVEVDGQRVHIANTHLHHRPIEDESIRLAQMQALLDWMFSRADSGWVLTGDMNALPESTTIAAAEARLNSAYFTLHRQHPITFPTPLVADRWEGPDLCIDYIFCDAARLQVQEARMIADQGHADDPNLYPSDHFGLAAEVTIIA
ncbi:MAG: endonuclease/exonuclease/phosphatase family protein [Anaerolineae bacterium]|nr:endonuclease/exonuclease/phosphatase family protein [Anaerolineae bacterium]